MSSDNKKTSLIITVVTSGVLVILCLFYLNPQILMTDTAKKLTEKDLVETENTIRGNVLSVGGAVFILGTLLVSIVQTGISQKNLNATLEQLNLERKTAKENLNLALNQFKLESERVSHEKEREWKNKVEAAYIEWAEAFLSATKQEIYIVRYRVKEDKQKKDEAKREHSTCHFIREKAVLRILMFEQRKRKPKPVVERFEEINKYPYPHYPIIKNIDDKNQKKDAETLFWDTANRNEKIIGNFYGVTKERLTKFCNWITNPEDEFEMPTFHNYLETVKTEIPALTSVIETILNKVPMSN